MFVNSKKIWQKISAAVICFAVSLLSGCSFFPKEKTTTPIAIAMATDDNYVLPTVVAMTSIFENAGKNTAYNITVMVPGDLKEESKEKLLSPAKKYERHTIDIYDMKDAFSDNFISGRMSTPTYYRLKLPSVLANEKKCIWIDGDTVTRADLTEMWNLNIEDTYLYGFADTQRSQASIENRLENFGVACENYICAGVMLMNLELMRQNGMERKFEDFAKEKHEKLSWHDQDVLNALCHNKIKDLPPKFGMMGYFAAIEYDECYAKKYYSREAWEDAVKNPVIIHYGCKPWKDTSVLFYDDWWQYAKKTDYFKEITEAFEEAAPKN